MQRTTLQESGGVPVSNAAPFSEIARIPYEIDEDASGNLLSIKNVDSTATMYFKWVPYEGTGRVFDTGDAGVVLVAGQGYSWDRLKRGRMLIGRSTVNNGIVAKDLTAVLR